MTKLSPLFVNDCSPSSPAGGPFPEPGRSLNKTGTYKYINGKVVKVSDAIPKIGFAAPTISNRVRSPYWDHNIRDEPVYITSTKQKHNLLKEEGLVEKGPERGAIRKWQEG